MDGSDRNYLRTFKINDNLTKLQLKKVSFEINFNIFTDNPFTFFIFETLITNNKS